MHNSYVQKKKKKLQMVSVNCPEVSHQGETNPPACFSSLAIIRIDWIQASFFFFCNVPFFRKKDDSARLAVSEIAAPLFIHSKGRGRIQASYWKTERGGRTLDNTASAARSIEVQPELLQFQLENLKPDSCWAGRNTTNRLLLRIKRRGFVAAKTRSLPAVFSLE